MTTAQKLETILAHIDSAAVRPAVIIMSEKDWQKLYDYCQKLMLPLVNIVEMSCVPWPVIKNIPVYFSDRVASFMLLCECPINQRPNEQTAINSKQIELNL